MHAWFKENNLFGEKRVSCCFCCCCDVNEFINDGIPPSIYKLKKFPNNDLKTKEHTH